MKIKNEVLEAIYKRRSIRNYKDKRVSKKIIGEILKAGVMAPSAMNQQPWRFIIIQNRKIISKLAEISAIECIKNGTAKKYGVDFSGEMIFYNAPVVVLVCGKKGYEWLRDDVNLCVQNMFLAAYSLGLGSCWIGFARCLNKNKQARKILKLPKEIEIVAPLIFGYSNQNKNIIPKRNPKILKWVE